MVRTPRKGSNGSFMKYNSERKNTQSSITGEGIGIYFSQRRVLATVVMAINFLRILDFYYPAIRVKPLATFIATF
jgi:hypothetical protein